MVVEIIIIFFFCGKKRQFFFFTMSPKKAEALKDTARIVKPNVDVSDPDQSGRVKGSDQEAEIAERRADPVRDVLQTFLQRQQQRDERWEKESQRQEHRWRTLQHQFSQIQSEVHQQRQERQSQGGVTVPHTPPAAERQYSPPSIHPHRQTLQVDHDSASTSAQVHDGAAHRERSSLSSYESPRMLQEHYLTTSERIANACRWPRQDWALHLLPLLTGKARAAYVAMEPEESLEYNHVRQAILDKFEINSETYRQRFRSHSLRENESAKELQVRLKDLYEKWMNPRHRTKEEVGDQIILEQFLKLLNPETRMWVKQNNLTSSKQAAEMAENFMAARRSVYPPGRWRSSNNSSTGKVADDFSSGLSNFNTYPHTSQSRNGSNTGSQQMLFKQYKTKPILVCHRCGQQGHKKIDCPLQNITNTRLCYVPRPPHSLDEARLNRDTVTVVKIGNKWFKALVDSGSSQTLVREECLDEQSTPGRGKVSVRCIHGDVREYPRIDLKIEIDKQSYVLPVGIVEQAPYPVILGRDVPILVDLL